MHDTMKGPNIAGFGMGFRVLNVGILWTAIFVALLTLWGRPIKRSDSDHPGFSLEKALVHLRAISAAPRPTGSETHWIGQQYLCNFLKSRDINPEIQRALVVNTSKVTSSIVFVAVENVLARISGKHSGKAILFVAHYDSADSTSSTP